MGGRDRTNIVIYGYKVTGNFRHETDMRFELICGVLSRQSRRLVADNLLHQTILAMTSLSYCRQVPTLPNQ